jgi:hypothetical protein
MLWTMLGMGVEAAVPDVVGATVELVGAVVLPEVAEPEGVAVDEVVVVVVVVELEGVTVDVVFELLVVVVLSAKTAPKMASKTIKDFIVFIVSILYNFGLIS